MDIENKNAWKECFSVDNVKLPTRYYFGFSAATGDLSGELKAQPVIQAKEFVFDVFSILSQITTISSLSESTSWNLNERLVMANSFRPRLTSFLIQSPSLNRTKRSIPPWSSQAPRLLLPSEVDWNHFGQLWFRQLSTSVSLLSEHTEDEQSSGVWRVFKIIFIVILVVALIAIAGASSYYLYNRQRRTKKRFY